MHGTVKHTTNHRVIQRAKELRRLRSLHTDDKAIRMEKVFHGRTFPEELGIRGDRKSGRLPMTIQSEGLLNPKSRLDGNGALFNNKLMTLSHFSDSPDDIFN